MELNGRMVRGIIKMGIALCLVIFGRFFWSPEMNKEIETIVCILFVIGYADFMWSKD